MDIATSTRQRKDVRDGARGLLEAKEDWRDRREPRRAADIRAMVGGGTSISVRDFWTTEILVLLRTAVDIMRVRPVTRVEVSENVREREEERDSRAGMVRVESRGEMQVERAEETVARADWGGRGGGGGLGVRFSFAALLDGEE